MDTKSHRHLRTQLKIRVEQMRKSSGQLETENQHSLMKGRGGFLTHKDLEEVFTDEHVRIQLEQDFPDAIDESDILKLSDLIRLRGRKLYAILLWIRESKRVKEIMLENDKDDDKIFRGGTDSEDIRLSYCNEEHLQSCPGFERIANEFYKKQWIVPPVLPTMTDQEFPAEYFIFPFEKAGARIAKGGGGEVYQVKIASGFLSGRDGQDFRDVVYKRVKKHDDKDWEKSLREVKTLRARKHPNVVPLLSSFRTGREYRLSPNDHDMYLYMIQPRADESMEAWMEYKQDSLHTMDQRQRHIRGMMYDLVSAVAYIHATIGEYIAYHHDLKPSNILRFSRGNDSIWKICDFGSSNSKLAQGDTGTDNMMASYIYTPPEYWPRGKNRDLGRTWDVFSLGCIFLELATLYKYGWNKDEGLTKFKERRTYNDDCPFSAEQTLRAKQQDASFFNNMVAVRSWLAHLRDDSSSRFRDILDLIEEMLNERRYERIFAFEVQIHMCQILDRDMDLPALKKLFREISQGPNKSQNGLDRRNNPLRRGKSKKWALDRSLLKILEEKGWNDSTPTSTEEFDLQSSGVLVTDVATTLPGSQHWKDRLVGDDLEEQNMKAFIDTKLYGRTALDEDLRKSFSSGAKRVALYGLWGMGKSHLAYQYATRLEDPHADYKSSKKHTFWVSARSIQTFHKDYERIAKAVDLSQSSNSPSSIRSLVHKWLNENSGTWLLVIDGLDLIQVLDGIQGLLPEIDYGQVLFTTRNRKILLDRQIVQSRHCHHVDKPGLDTSWRIFKYHFGDSALKDNDSYYSQILERFTSPLLIKLAAEHMSKNTMTSMDMCNRLKCDVVDTVKDLHEQFKNSNRQTPRYMDLLLYPLIGSDSNSEWRPELRLLCILACFDTDKLDFDIIRWYNRQRGATHEYIGTLKNCSFLEQGSEKGDDGSKMCKMPELVRESAIAWVRKMKGEMGVWQRYCKMLEMLSKCYDERKKKYKNEVNEEDWSYSPKVPLMAHFERFRIYVKGSAIKVLSELTLSDNTVAHILEFSSGYLAEGKHQKALHVLQFASRFYKEGKYHYKLSRALVGAHISYQHDRTVSHPTGWEEPERICQELLQHYKETGTERQRGELILDLAKIYRLREKWEKAAEQLRSLERIAVRRDDEGRPASPLTEREGKELSDDKWLILYVERAHGQLLLAMGCKRETADDELEKAKAKLRTAKEAAMKWFPQNRTWIIDTDDLIAKATLERGTMKELQEVEEILERNLRELRCRAPLRRQFETELHLAKIRMKGNKNRAPELVRSLEAFHIRLGKNYGDKDRATHECQRLLDVARSRLDDYKRAQRRKLGVEILCFLAIGLLILYVVGVINRPRLL